MRKNPTPIDHYLESVTGERRVALDRLRRTIRAAVPKAEECLSYGIPAFRLEGGVVAGFAATARGCSYFPFSGATLATLAAELAGYGQTKAALHFDPARPLPAALVRRLIQVRRGELVRRSSSSARRAAGSRPRTGPARPRGRRRRAPPPGC